MSKHAPPRPLLVDFYEQYLIDQDTRAFVRTVTGRYSIASLARLAEWGPRLARRGAVLAIGLLGDYEANPILGKALIDRDRGVRTLADNGIRNLWCRCGSAVLEAKLAAAMRLNNGSRHDEAEKLCTELIHEAPAYAEAWNQRAVARFHREHYEASIRDCQQALEINPYHFTAASGMGRCYLRLADRAAALECFRRALRLNPGLEDVRAHISRLQRSIKDD